MILHIFIMALFGSIIGSLFHHIISQKINDTPPFYLHLKTLHNVNTICPSCYKNIKRWQPFSTFTLLRKKNPCHGNYHSTTCNQISYELLFSVLFVVSKIKYSCWSDIVIFLLLSSWFFLLAIYDIKFFLLPDYLTISLFFFGISLSYYHIIPLKFIDSIYLSFILFFVLWLMNFLFCYYQKEYGLGDGDIKLMMALSTWFPLIDILHILILSSSTALLWIIIIWFIKRKTLLKIPFGPFILVSAWIILLFK